jgi:hypothetical protein
MDSSRRFAQYVVRHRGFFAGLPIGLICYSIFMVWDHLVPVYGSGQEGSSIWWLLLAPTGFLLFDGTGKFQGFAHGIPFQAAFLLSNLILFSGLGFLVETTIKKWAFPRKAH